VGAGVILAIVLVVAYLGIGFTFEALRVSGDFDAGMLLLWPFSIDIRVSDWWEVRRIKREGAQRFTEVVAERNGKLRLIDLSWTTASGDEALATVAHGDKIDTWHGSGTVWHLPNGNRASTWMESWLYDHWEAARRVRQEQRA